ncbi:translocation/assembly module TamB domain-containing protein [Idiomarina abyssalis]|uniref:translocation/assembly module TamB domain-containing protein n=1 Tax=Idiomarina abyssalis TaxID=86102 RepID=UPI001CD6A820|nr:translocation/assembly module TamB domain-containing protein [Idiomarina abyssalis]
MRVYRWLAGTILSLVLLVPIIAFSLVASESGSRWVLTQAQKYAPVEFSYSQFNGSLLNEFEFRDFSLEAGTFSYAPEQLKVSWKPFALLSGVLRINSVKSNGGEIRLRAAEQEQSDASETSIQDISIELPIDFNVLKLSIEKTQFFILETPAQSLNINASVRLDTSGSLNIRELQLEHQYMTTTISGRTKLSYPFDSNLNNNTHLHSPDYPELKVKSRIVGNLHKLSTTSELSEGLIGTISAELQDPISDLKWQLTSQWQDNNITPWLASFGADTLNLSFNGTLNGQGGMDHIELEPSISVMVNKQQADIDGNLNYRNNILALNALNIQPQGDIDGVLTLQGEISSLKANPEINVSATWDEIIYEPNQLTSRNGKLTAQGTIGDLAIYLDNTLTGLLGNDLNLTTEAELTEKSLKLTQWRLSQNDEQVNGNAIIEWKDNLSLAANLTGNFQQQTVDAKVRLRLLDPYLFVDQLEARWGPHSLLANGALSPGSKLNWKLSSADLSTLSDIKGELAAEGSINGQLNQSRFDFDIAEFHLKLPDYNAITLNQSVAGSFNYQESTFDVTPVCLNYKGLRKPLCAQLEQQKDSVNFTADASQVPLNLLQAIVLPDSPYTLSGELSLEIDGEFNNQTMRLEKFEGVVNADNSKIQAGEEVITLNQLVLKAKNGAEQDLDISLTAKANELDFDLSGELNIEQLNTNSPISGKVLLSSKSLELLNLFAPQINIGDGNTKAELTIAGKLNDPTASGSMNLSADRIVLLSSGTLITNLEAELTADANVGQFTVSANGTVGQGDVDIKGRFNVLKRVGLLTIKGKDLLILDTPDLLLSASPDVKIELQENLITLTGDLDVPKARITPVELNQAVTESADVNIKNEKKEESLFRTKADITVSLGKSVRVEAMGFSGNLQGQLRISQQPNSAATGNGSIGVVSGDYEIYGQKLAIERGDLLFNGGPLDTPSLNLRVTRNIKGNGASQRPPEIIGARVTGTIEQPELSLFSTPPLPDSTILSYLLFGKPPGNQGDVNNLELQAALLVGGRSTEFLTEGIKSTFDLDEVSLDSETNDVNDTSLYIGKYLSPQLYIKYGIGLLEPTSTFILRYTLSERLLFESTSSTEGQGGDLIYTIEN